MASVIGCHEILTSRVKKWLQEQWIHLKSYETRVRELKDIVDKLNKKRDRIQHTVDEEEHRHAREILDDVKEWIERADGLFFEYADFNDDPSHELAVFDLLQNGYLPKPGLRYRRSRKALEITKKANGLLETATFDSFSYWTGPPSMAAFFSNLSYESFPSREETIGKIIEELEKPSVRMIGLFGLSGVGKTTLVKQVVKETLEEKMFDVVTMASVTKTPDIRKIQGQIVDMLGVILDEESDIARAAKIQNMLKNEKKNTLIILDDLWENLDLNMLGVPYEIDNDVGTKNVKEGKSVDADGSKNVKEGKYSSSSSSTSTTKAKKSSVASNRVKTEKTLARYKGCKILLISESKQVLLNQMGGNAKSIFKMEVLKEKEAEMLFKKMAEIGDKNSEFEKLAVQIANKCKGLPMSIVTTARALKDQNLSVWEDINRRLERQNSTGASEFSTKLSYDYLEDEELKYTFLLCARMGHDALIMDLVKHCIGLGFLQGVYTVRETRDRVFRLVAKLKESGLLSDSYSIDHFTMQDIVRNAALSLAYKENLLFTMTKGKIDEWPDKLERYAAISLHHCEFIEGFLKKINYRRLNVFHVNNNDPKLQIPKNFFKGMKELRVLILTGIHLSLLKLSISSLTELRMLCLEQCMLDKDLSYIGKLKKLRILSFSGSDIDNLPVELKQLQKLQIFDISNCSKLKEIPSSVISSLVSLEELYMRSTLIQWEVEERMHESKKASLSELKHLNQLTTLDIQISEVSFLPKDLFFDQLYSYKIVIGDLTAYLESDFKMPEKYETSRFLAISKLKAGFDIHSLKGIKMLFERVENLFLEELNSVHEEDNIVHDIFYRLNLKGFPYLKNLLIMNDSTVQSLIHPEDRKHPEKAFPKLESLYLYNLKKMDNICSCELSEPSFGKLKVIKINLCGQLKNVFLISVARLLSALETLEVSECNSLKEIVPEERQSNNNEIKLLKFLELRCLKLQSLSKFIGLYPISSIEGKAKELFHEKVEVSKLERLELSSIQIDTIWSDQPSLRSSFKNLTHLDVNGCWELKSLISLSMAKSLVSLQSLFVSGCEKMRSIFPQEKASNQKLKGSVFPKLKNIKLSSMKSLSEIWNSKLPSDSFSKLDTLIIEECDKLVDVFPCYIRGIFRSLCNLRVTNCRSMQAIFNILEQVWDVANLQDVHLESLPELEHVWKLNKDQERILNFDNLQKIWVQRCDSLENIFPFSVAKRLGNLEYLVVWDCFVLREIVAKGEPPNTETANLGPSFDFPKLGTVRFSELPRLTSFYPGAFRLSCPTLNELSIQLCDMLEPFNKESAGAQRKRGLFPEQVINKLKIMHIESWHAKSPSSYMGEENHRRDNLEELCLSRLMDTKILYSFLHRNPNLKSLSLNNCFFEEIVPHDTLTKIEKLGVVPKLKSLKLIDLPKLKETGFEPDIILKRIELLILKNCPCMITVVPSSASLTRLTNLEVVNCDGLKNLMSSSTAKSLGQLNTMKVIKCGSLMEIVGKEGENVDKIVFKQLKALELVSLKNLKSFCSSESCDFEFPSLEKLVVSACYTMEKFSEKVSSTPILQNIYVVHEKEKKRCCWEGDLNDTIRKIFDEKKYLEGMDEMSFSEHPELPKAWKGEVDLQTSHSWFYSLKILKLEKCRIQQAWAIPSNVLPNLKSIKELEVRNCKDVKGIFEMDATEGAETTFQLQKLTLKSLRNLVHVWKRNGKETHSFQNLQVVLVSKCANLETLFPAGVAKNLKKLDKLEIEFCSRLLNIVEKEEADVTQEFVFPCLTTLDLFNLPQLIYFYPESFTLNCPVLNTLTVVDCVKLELFKSAANNRRSLFFSLKGISNLEEMTLDVEHDLVLRSSLGELTDPLIYLNYIGLYFDVDVNAPDPILPIEILQKAPNLKEMSIEFCLCHNIFLGQIPELTHLKILTLNQVSNLESIWSGNSSSWLNMICDKIHQLSVYSCPHLTTLGHSTSAVSFLQVKELYITDCPGLKYLFTFSAAKQLINLEQMEVWNCKSIREIVANDQETPSGEINLERLYRVDLIRLPSLECFNSGNYTLQLPSLIQVDIWKCPKMEIFSGGTIHANSFRGIQASRNSNDELILYNDVNSSVKKVFLLQDHLVFGGSYMEKIWSQSEPLPYGYFPNLTSMVVEGCEFLTNAILPSHLLPSLINLKKLRVRKCKSLKAIFSHTEIINMGPQESLSIPFLKELHVENCEELVAIVARNTADTEEANKKLTICSTITLLRLSNLQNLRCIYPGTHILEWGMLKELDVKQCQRLKFFGTEFQNSQDLHPDGQDGFSTDQQAIVSLKKVTPCMEEMSLGKEEEKMIERGELLIDLPKLNLLKLQFFDGVFPFVFDSKVSLPSIERLGLLHSAFKEIVPPQTPDVDFATIFSKLKELELQNLSQLKSIGLEHSWISPFLENLETLVVWNCHCLTNLTPSTVSFSNLIKLNVKNCRGLKYLLTFSTAKTLVVLKEMCITNCKSIKTIVAKDGEEEQQEQGDDDGEGEDEEQEQGEDDDDKEENEDEDEDDDDDDDDEEEEEEDDDDDDDDDEGEGEEDKDENEGEGEEDKDKNEGEDDDDEEENEDEEDDDDDDDEGEEDEDEDENEGEGEKDKDENEGEGEDELIFKKLQILTFSSLPKLRSFYTGSSPLNFPSLEEVSFSNCPNVKLFRLGIDRLPPNPNELLVKINEKICKSDINSVIMQHVEEETS